MQQKVEFEGQATGVKAEIKEFGKLISDGIKDHAVKQVPKMDSKTMAFLCLKTPPAISDFNLGRDENKGQVYCTATFKSVKDNGNSNNYYDRDRLNVAIEFKIPPQIKKLEVKRDAKQKDLEDIKEKLLETRKNLSNINYLERKANAKVTKATLSHSKDGREFLEKLGKISGMPKLTQ